MDLALPRSREEHSIRLRRAALLEHSTLAWRAALAGRAGTGFRRFPSCTVLACSDPVRSEEIRHRLAQQRGVDDLEVVVVTREAAAPASAEALDHALEAATGDVVVVLDDAGRYGDDVVADLLLARHYSGAALVEMPAGPGHVDDPTGTLRPTVDTERFVTELDGGPMLVSRRRLRELGGFRGPQPGAGSSLVTRLQAHGEHAYRTHGIGLAPRATASPDPADSPTDPGRLP